MKRLLSVALILCLSLLCGGCWWYSFSGTSIDPDAKTISVKYIDNRAERINPALSNLITEALQDRYTKQTRLSVISEDGDYAVSGEIVEYRTQAMAVTADEVASQTRLTITVNIRFENKINPRANFEQRFSQYADYDSTQSLDAVEAGLCDEIVEKIVDEIFNATVANW